MGCGVSAQRGEHCGAGIPACGPNLNWQAGMPAPLSGCDQRLPQGMPKIPGVVPIAWDSDPFAASSDTQYRVFEPG